LVEKEPNNSAMVALQHITIGAKKGFKTGKHLVVDDEKSVAKLNRHQLAMIAIPKEARRRSWDLTHPHSQQAPTIDEFSTHYNHEIKTWGENHVTLAHSVEAAFEEYGKCKGSFDLICLDNWIDDQKMPGIQIAATLREEGYQGPIIMITSSDPDQLTFLHDGAKCRLKMWQVIGETLTPIEVSEATAQSTLLLPHNVYYVKKPLTPGESVLKNIIRHHFELTDAVHDFDNTHDISHQGPLASTHSISEHPVFQELQVAAKCLAESRPTGTVVGTPDTRLTKALQVLTKLSQLEIIDPPGDAAISFGTIPTARGRREHIATSALSQIGMAMADPHKYSGQWKVDAKQIATAALDELEKHDADTEENTPDSLVGPFSYESTF